MQRFNPDMMLSPTEACAKNHRNCPARAMSNGELLETEMAFVNPITIGPAKTQAFARQSQMLRAMIFMPEM